ncbi:hypothetical protein BRYFOR_05864 [Marvinbryantia formatexigens DSM 14469]|uniref:Uncharacterized protein n=1 Tax=Marvinbryantia formatexigens DSM 14469 TaxID=478749 RepID=C6LB69_9FIRM|nr:hypothetical protein BRYFOR_05864 [Marvinbryantia formatexigens DSM 14469]
MKSWRLWQKGRKLNEKHVDSSVLLDFALETISEMQYSVGGVMEFLS